jgi:hypothetical protein
MFEDGTVTFRATVKTSTLEPLAIDLSPDALSVMLRCNGRLIPPHARSLPPTTPTPKPSLLPAGGSTSFEIPGLFAFTPVAGTCLLTFRTWYRRPGDPAIFARPVESNVVKVEIVDERL